MSAPARPELFLHHPASPVVRKVLLLVSELDLALVEHTIDPSSEQEMLRYAEVNPNRKFPALRHGDFVLWESNAIMSYLAQGFGGETLLGERPRDSAKVQQWLSWEVSQFYPVVQQLQNHRLGFLPTPFQPEAQLLEQFSRLCQVLETELAEPPWILGHRLSLADFAIAAALTFAGEAGIDVSHHPRVTAWLQAVSTRPSWQRTEERKRDVLAKFAPHLLHPIGTKT